MVVLRGGAYCGLAPVPGGRVNVGIVLAGRRGGNGSQRGGRARRWAQAVARGDPAARRRPRGVARRAPITDAIAGASPLGSRVARRAGPGWLARRRRGRVPRPVHRRGAAPGARVGPARRGGDRRASCAAVRTAGGLAAYDRAMAAGSPRRTSCRWLVQAFLARPALFEYAGGGLPTRRRPCDDGPRDGRPRARVPRPRSAVPRRAPAAVSDATEAVVQRVRLARLRVDRARRRRAPVPDRRRGRGARPLDAARRRPRVRRGPGRRRAPRAATRRPASTGRRGAARGRVRLSSSPTRRARAPRSTPSASCTGSHRDGGELAPTRSTDRPTSPRGSRSRDLDALPLVDARSLGAASGAGR